MTSPATMNGADGLIAVLGRVIAGRYGGIGTIIGGAAGRFLPFQVRPTTSAV